MKNRRLTALVAMVAVLALVATACGGGNETPGSDTSSTPAGDLSGGTLREEYQSFAWTGGFDPTGEYLGTAWTFYTGLLLRGLMTYNHKSADEGGDTPVPDIATADPEVSDDGLTYTFTLRDNVMWGPPLDRAVTSADIAYAFSRINTASLAAQYGSYYCGTIVGMTCDAKEVEPVSGIETPDETTIIFTLEQPIGDFMFRLAMPATYAIPEEVAGCFTKAGDYGTYVMSSGPYMIMGQDELDISSCEALIASGPISGYDIDKGMTLVRNPNYDPSTDNPENRSAYVDGFEIVINTNLDDSFDRLFNGDIDMVSATPPTAALQQLLTDPEIGSTLHSDSSDRTNYVTMNLLAPPFDDPAVRKAVNLALNKTGMIRPYGGEVRGVVATSVEPPTVLPGSETINPYPENTGEGNIEAAMEAMKESIYDTDGDGVCDAPECEDVLFLGRSEDPYPDVNQVAVESLKPLGLDLVLREVDTGTGYTTIQQVKKLVPISAVPGWGKDYLDSFGFNFGVFSNQFLGCTTATNYSNLGITAAQADECGVKAEYDAFVEKWGEVPGIDAKMDECIPLTDAARDECFFEMDTYLMEEAIPWAPWVWVQQLTTTNDANVAQYAYDASSGWASYSHMAVTNDLEPQNVA